MLYIVDMKTGVISKAKGSAYIEMGDTKVICSIFDPREIPTKQQTNFSTNGELNCEFRYLPYSQKRRTQRNDVVEKSLTLSLKRALLPAVCRYAFSNFQVDIFVDVIEDDGSVLAAAINCAGLALVDAGIPMYDLLSASTLSIFDNQVLIDPTKAEEEICSSVDLDQEHGIIVMSSLNMLDQVSEMWLCGLICPENLSKLIDLLKIQNQEIILIVKQILVNKVQKSLKDNDSNVDAEMEENDK